MTLKRILSIASLQRDLERMHIQKIADCGFLLLDDPGRIRGHFARHRYFLLDASAQITGGPYSSRDEALFHARIRDLERLLTLESEAAAALSPTVLMERESVAR